MHISKLWRNAAALFTVVCLVALIGCDNNTKEDVQLEDFIAASPAGTPIEGQYIVVLKPALAKSSAQMATEMASLYNLETEFVYETALNGFSAKVPAEKLEALRNDSRVSYVEQDQVVKLIPYIQEVHVQKSLAQSTPWGITRVGGSGNGVGKRAWIIDTGIDLDHPDLTVDLANSKSFLSGNQSTNPDDQNGHGTHVAGTVAAKSNTINVVGVAAGATVVSVRVLDRRGSGTTSGVIAGVNYVASKGVTGETANMSLGGGVSTTLDNAVLAASSKVKFALAAGNESDNANNHSPARVNGANIYTVSAVNSSDVFASFSNYGNPPVDYAAPGVSILSLWKNGGTNTISGTSMATPHVCGILLLGNITSDGTAVSDPAAPADPIAHR
ncbi:S8 family serine peptidase [bacterium]|nr:MAG: S8 family serine peptidase [bacterium]